MDDHQFALCIELCSVTGMADEDMSLAQFYLEDTGWKLEEAIVNYKQSQSDAQRQVIPAPSWAESSNAATPVVSTASTASGSTTSQESSKTSSSSTSSSSAPEEPQKKRLHLSAPEEPQKKRLRLSSPEEPPKKKIRLITWNIDGLDERDTRERTLAACSTLRTSLPDIIFLQEVIPPTLTLIESSMPDYKVIPASRDGYFTAILLKKSSVQLVSQEVDPFPSSEMQRALQTVQVKCAGVELHLMCSHLESTKQHATERIKQLKIAFEDMNNAPSTSTVIFGGDCNLRDPEVTKAGLPKSVFDIWQLCGEPADAKFTWDLSKNDNLNWPYPNRPKCRFDRLYFKHDTGMQISAENFSLIGKKRLPGCKRFPSDHWGIMCDFKIKE